MNKENPKSKRRSLKKRGIEAGMKLVSKVFEDPERANKVMAVVGKVQKGKAKIDEATARMLNAGHLLSRDDLSRLSRHVGALKRELRGIKTRLESIRRRIG